MTEMIESIKADIRHEPGCAVERHTFIQDQEPDGHSKTCAVCGYTEGSWQHRGGPLECNCSRRKKIAFLECLKEPTEGMIQKMRFTNRRTLRGQLIARFKAAIKAAEEDHD